MKVKVSEASGPVLDWMVVKVVGKSYVKDGTDYAPDGRIYQRGTAQPTGPHYSSDWSLAGPILDNHIFRLEDGDSIEDWPERWLAEGGQSIQYGSTALVAICRCYVAFKLSDEVEVPDELA